MTETIREVLASARMDIAEVDLVIPHQANLRILETVRKRLKVGEERFVYQISEVGNTTTASIPLALEYSRQQGRLQRGHRVLCVAFGAGFTWGGTLFVY